MDTTKLKPMSNTEKQNRELIISFDGHQISMPYYSFLGNGGVICQKGKEKWFPEPLSHFVSMFRRIKELEASEELLKKKLKGAELREQATEIGTKVHKDFEKQLSLIPFSLERALAGDPVITRDGRKVIRFAHFTEDEKWPIVFFVKGESGKISANPEGEVTGFSKDNLDLFMAPKTRTVWVNLYNPKSKFNGFARWHLSEYFADQEADGLRLGGKAYPIEITE
jgi:hypothetical protein